MNCIGSWNLIFSSSASVVGNSPWLWPRFGEEHTRSTNESLMINFKCREKLLEKDVVGLFFAGLRLSSGQWTGDLCESHSVWHEQVTRVSYTQVTLADSLADKPKSID